MGTGVNEKSGHNKKLGKDGEDLAARHLTNAGMTVLSRNWRCREGELDLVLTDGQRLVVCEVKTRSGDGFGTPAESVTAAKSQRIRRLANLWLSAHHVGWCVVRFDVIAVVWPASGQPRLTHFEDVF
ncbi:MAG: YraN family protein [Pseudonocardiaceae bacterium]|nr:YraN family protein [Pseudonocardiaceae bacterium]